MYDTMLHVVNSAREEVVPICDSTINEVDSFITSITPTSAYLSADAISGGVQKANALFSSSAESGMYMCNDV